MIILIRDYFFQAEDGIRDRSVSRGLGDVYKRQINAPLFCYLNESNIILTYKNKGV
ncbi:hypothetical protein JMUB7555_27170 [Staphylococcus aureus]